MGSFGDNTIIGHDVCVDHDKRFHFRVQIPLLPFGQKNSHMFN